MKRITGATIALLSLLAVPAMAAENIITVNSLTSSNATVDDSFCTLHEAIKAANDNADNPDGCAAGSALDDDIIEFDVATVELTKGLPNIRDGLVIRGPIAINLAPAFPVDQFVFRTPLGFDAGERLVLDNVSIDGATIDNPLIYINNDDDQMALDIIGGTYSNNTNTGAGVLDNGAVLRVTGNVEVNLLDVTMSGNEAISGSGGAVSTAGNGTTSPTVNIQGGVFTANKAPFSAAIDITELSGSPSAGDHVINGSVFSLNESASNIGAVYLRDEQGNVALSNVQFIGNTAGGLAGAVSFQSIDATDATQISCVACTFSGNQAGTYAAAIRYDSSNVDDSLLIDQSVFEGNSTADGAGNDGGALHVDVNAASGSVLVTNTTFSNNVSGNDGGAIFCENGNAVVRLVNSTISGNASRRHGGGINSACETSLNNVTVTNNTAGVGNMDNTTGRGGGVRRNGGTLAVQNSVIAGNIIGLNDEGEDCFGNVTSAGYNFIGTDNDCAFGIAVGDTVGGAPSEDPMLGMLASNGGSTETHLPMAGSPLIDAGNPAGCDDGAAVPALLTDDQTGATRPVNGQCDIGAVEVQLDPPAPTGNTVANNGAVAPTDVAAGDAGVEALGLILTNTSGETVDFTSLTLAATGDANAASDITAVTLYADTNCDGDLDGGDVNLGSAPGFGTFNFASQTVASGGQLCFVVTVDTNVTLAALVMPMFAASSLMLIGMMGLGGFGGRRKLLTVLLAAGVFSLAGCHGDDDDGAGAGGGGGGGGGPATATYTVTATAVGGTGQTSNKAASVSGLPTSGQAITITEP